MPAVMAHMIGGFDRHFALSRQRVPEALDAAAHAIFRRWRRAVIQASDGSIFLTLGDVPLSSATSSSSTAISPASATGRPTGRIQRTRPP